MGEKLDLGRNLSSMSRAGGCITAKRRKKTRPGKHHWDPVAMET